MVSRKLVVARSLIFQLCLQAMHRPLPLADRTAMQEKAASWIFESTDSKIKSVQGLNWCASRFSKTLAVITNFGCVRDINGVAMALEMASSSVLASANSVVDGVFVQSFQSAPTDAIRWLYG